MKISPFIFLAIFCIFSVSIVSGIEISVTDLHCVAHGVAPSGYLGDPDQIILAGSDNDIISTDIFGSGMSVNSITDFPTDVVSIYNTKNWIYVSLVDGRAYKIPSSPYQRAFGDLNFADEDHKDGYYLGDFSTGTTLYNNRIVADSNNDIYIYSAFNKNVYKIDGTTLVSSEFISTSEIESIATSANRNRLDIFVHDNGLYVAVIDTNNNLDLYKYTSTNTKTKIYDNAILSTDNVVSYLAPLSNDNWILGAATYSNTRTQIIEYNGTASIGNVYYGTGYYPTSTDSGNLIIKPNGIICFAATTQDKIVTFSSISGAGGVYTEEEGSTPVEIDYNVGAVSSEYENYYNMSNVNVKWSIAIDEDYINTWTNTHNKPIQDTYKFRIEIFSPLDVFVSSYDIPKSSWKYQSYTLGLFGKGDYVTSGQVEFSNIRGNGTWKVKLYEYNTITGAKGFIDSDTFLILDQDSPIGTGTQPIDSNPTNIVSNFLESPYLIAIIIIGVVGFQFGRGKDGNINGSAMVVLIPLAVGLCALMGLLPMWILYTMVLCIIAFIAMKLSSGGS
ncbi:hypothetical protein KO361_06030 [Candidatus Woesearchaeota archaeon]|nr:hypothetical protein [Candidatus Woesearchaeota archaeon]